MRGLDELRAMWRATRDEAQSGRRAGRGARADQGRRWRSSSRSRKQIETSRETLLVLQDRVVQEAARCREAIDQLIDYRRTAVGRLLVRDGRADLVARALEPELGRDDRAGAGAAAPRPVPVLLEYARLQLPRLPFQIALFVLLLVLWRRARQRTVGWLAEDRSLAPVAAVFEHPDLVGAVPHAAGDAVDLSAGCR